MTKLFVFNLNENQT